ncbi:hypothetical protein N183_37690 [Sinorhizobium sp. Sb3]|nr:hypothetical protein N183_37690 [Sinorhizobium sp. Sb3]
MKTRKPLILTARIAETDLEPFDRLRKAHFRRIETSFGLT